MYCTFITFNKLKIMMALTPCPHMLQILAHAIKIHVHSFMQKLKNVAAINMATKSKCMKSRVPEPHNSLT